MSDKPKSVLDIIGCYKELETRLAKVEGIGEVIIDSGDVGFSQDPLLTSGENKKRQRTVKIKFGEKFKTVMEVIPSIKTLDSHHKCNVRIDVSAENITNEGFDLIITTWYDTMVWVINVKWYAIGTRKI